MAPFHLSKWYLDCVTDSGNASIVYVGELRWGPVHLCYSSLLRSIGDDVKQQNSLRSPTMPAITGDEVSWNSPQFNFSGVWRSNSSQVQETVFANEEGSVEWRCLMPAAHVQAGNDFGLGYVEHLTMTIAPWKIPIQRLRWGRFCGASDSVVWIDWDGELSKRILYANGKGVSGSIIEDGELTFEESRLTMDRSLTLRNGPLGTTALSSIPGISKTFPVQLLQVNECKWRSRARLERANRPAVEGWAIHEVVSWPK